MPKKHRVPTLVELSMVSVGRYVAEFAKIIIPIVNSITKFNPEKGALRQKWLVTTLKNHLSASTPWHLFDGVAKHVLRSIEISIGEMKQAALFLSGIDVQASLTEIVVHRNLRTIQFPVWPKIMRQVLYRHLSRMTGLRVLDMGSGSAGWRTADIEKLIVGSLKNLSNLKVFVLCFDCTDSIVTALSQSCEHLQKLDVTASRSVTDRSVGCFARMSRLKELKLFRTSVTVYGMAEILKRRSIEDIGRCDDLGFVLERLEGEGVDSLRCLRRFECRYILGFSQLRLIAKMLPRASHLTIMIVQNGIDLRVLSSLECMEELKFLGNYFYANRIDKLLEKCGSGLVSLHFERVDEIDPNALILISESCTRLRKLVFYNCDFLNNSYPLRKLRRDAKIFEHLEEIKCVVDCASVHLEFLLSNCRNIRFIQLGSSTGICDETMRKVFRKNSMRLLEELKILYSSDLSMETVRILMENCENLRRLTELESWQGIAADELDQFRREIRKGNIDLDTSPTLSFA